MMVMMVVMVMMMVMPIVMMVMMVVTVVVVLGHLERALVRGGIAALALRLLDLHRVGNWVQELHKGASGLEAARLIEGRGRRSLGSADESKR
jgi:hypothetical protein